METRNKILIASMVFLTAFVFIGWNKNNIVEEKNTIVLVKYKAQPSKETTAVDALVKLIEEVRKEPHFVTIKLHVDPKDKTNILLYEEWSNETYYNTEHMKTAHLQKFIGDSRNFLAGPPEITFWQLDKEFK